MNLDYLEGRKLCVVFVKVLEPSAGRVQCRALRGRAAINQGHLDVMTAKGAIFTVPSSAYHTIAQSDGTKILGDSEYFCLVKVDPNIDIEHGGECANLIGTNLEGANLEDANLRGANLDYSCWPLWCGSLRNVRIDKRIFAQLAYHICRVIVDDDECRAAQRALYPIANQFHRVSECGRLSLERNNDNDD